MTSLYTILVSKFLFNSCFEVMIYINTLFFLGSLTFSDKTTAQALQLSSANIMVHSLNGLNVEAAKADLVIVNEDASIAGPLKFTSSITGIY